MDSLHFFYLGALVPIGLLWAAMQDFVTNADTPEQRSRVRRTGQLLSVLGLAHPGMAWVGLDMVRSVSTDEFAAEPGASAAHQRVRTVTIVSVALAVVGAVAWLLR